MKIKKILILVLLLMVFPVLNACDVVFNLPSKTTTAITQTTTRPETVNGTITFEDSAYQGLPVYNSPTYDLTDVDLYNDVLLETLSHIRHSNVEIYATQYEYITMFPFSNEQRRDVGLSSGSGFIFMEDESYYYAITNYHVIDPDGYLVDYEIKAYGDTDFTSCEVIASDQVIDLAVVKFPKLARQEIELIDIYERLYYQFTPGELVLAVGNPLDVYNIVTIGEFMSMEGIQNVEYDVIYHNAQIDEGSSGGALVDVDGNLLGVNTWGLETDDSNSFAIPNYIVYMFLINHGIIS